MITPPTLPTAVAELHAIGVYEPALPGGRVVVDVEHRRPVILSLSSHDSVYWDVRAGEGVEIVGVILSGWEVSSVWGLPPGTPVVTSIAELGEPGFYAYEQAGDDWAAFNAGLAGVVGPSLQLSSFQGAEVAPERFRIP